MSYWAYSDPHIQWLGTLPELYPVAHIYIGIKAIVLGLRLRLASSIVKEELVDFVVVLIVFTVVSVK